MARDITLGLSVTFMLWVGVIAYASSRLVWANWSLFKTIWRQDRETRVKMALWVAIFGMKLWLLWNRGIVLWVLITHRDAGFYSPFAIAQSIFVLPWALIVLGLMLWWACDRTYGPELGDRVWWRLVWAGLALGAASWLASWSLE